MVGRFLGIRPHDRRDTLVAFAVLTAMMAGHALLETARDALFLSKLDADRLPLAYIAIAGLALAVGALNRKALARYSPRRALSATLVFGALITGVFWLLLEDGDSLILGAFYVWVGLLATVVVLQFWLQLGEVFDVGQAKRVFSIVGAGGLVGATAGSLLASVVLTNFDARVLLLFAVMAFIVAAIAPLGFSKPADAPIPRRRTKVAPRRRNHLANPYLLRLFIVALVSAVLITGVDYLFKSSVARTMPREELGSFFAKFYAALNAVSLMVQLAIAPRLLRAFGVNRTLLLLPFLLLLGSVGLAIVGGLIPALILKSADGALRHSLNRTSTEILYLPLASEVRARFKSFVDAVGQRGGQALASVLLLAAAWLGATPFAIAVALGVLASIWLVVVKGLEPHYLELFRKQLREGKAETQINVPDLDLHSLEVLVSALSADRDDEVVGALDMFEAFGKTNLIPALILYHPARVVVLHAFDLFSATDRPDVLRLADRMLSHADPEIRGAALRLFASAKENADLLAEHAESDHPELRAVALAWRARLSLASDDVTTAGFEALVESSDPRERLAAAYAIRDLPPRFAWVALRLAKTADTQLAPVVARAMAVAPAPEYLPALVDLLAHRAGRGPARAALIKLEDRALDALALALSDPSTSRNVRLHIPRTISKFGGQRAAQILIDHLDNERDERVVFKVLRGLSKMRTLDSDIPIDASVLFAKTRKTVEQAITALSWHLCVERYLELCPGARTKAAQLLLQIAREKESWAMARTFRLLNIIEPTDDFKMIYFGLRSEDAKTRATSRELLSHVVSPPLRDVILKMVDDESDHHRLRATAEFFQPPTTKAFFEVARAEAFEAHPAAAREAYASVLKEMLEEPSETLHVVVRYHIDELGLADVARSAVAVEKRPLAKMAERALGMLDIRGLEPAETE